ncbi:MAG: xanthine dehydrogenase family protein subunit M, partial [Acidocella sp.]|nr:xanthine dehydrogenase family protein subunit M [Acidocella sp.]
ESFYRLPGHTPAQETELAPGELIIAMRLPPNAAAFAAHQRYLKVRDRTSYAFAVVSAAAALQLDAGRIKAARLALGGVAMRPWRARAAEAVLLGAKPESTVFRKAAEAALADAKPAGGHDFKIELARRVISRAFVLAMAGTPSPLPALPASPFALPQGVLHV